MGNMKVDFYVNFCWISYGLFISICQGSIPVSFFRIYQELRDIE